MTPAARRRIVAAVELYASVRWPSEAPWDLSRIAETDDTLATFLEDLLPLTLNRVLELEGDAIEPVHAQLAAYRRPGRPSGPTLPRARIVDTYRELVVAAAARGRRPTQADLAVSLGIGTRTLQNALTAYGLGWPIE